MATKKTCKHKNIEIWDVCGACGASQGKCKDCGATYEEDIDHEKEWDV